MNHRLVLYTSITLLVFLTTSIVTLAQVNVETTRGEAYSGSIIRENSDSLALLTSSGDTLWLAIADIQFLDRNGDNPQGPESYFVFGGHLGTPAYLVNLDIGYYWPGIGFRLSGAYYGEIGGIQLDVAYPLRRSADHSMDLYLATGRSYFLDLKGSDDILKWTYVGAGLHARWSLFFLSAGMNFGTGDYTNPGFLVQLGFLWEMTQ